MTRAGTAAASLRAPIAGVGTWTAFPRSRSSRRTSEWQTRGRLIQIHPTRVHLAECSGCFPDLIPSSACSPRMFLMSCFPICCFVFLITSISRLSPLRFSTCTTAFQPSGQPTFQNISHCLNFGTPGPRKGLRTLQEAKAWPKNTDTTSSYQKNPFRRTARK